ncbi:hypothetical protein J2W52_005321 [Rhizobium miluonense]|jgi:hypothetical protein|uniref:Uncharacterized protein n=1 Tax=Rhizobium miluonense TaxID=411945 RepID=A0ABU1SZ40_9HYPH|nr:hypothetical protein [Rhizobium miluonense]
MSSNPAASHVDPADFKLVREVLRSAGLRASESDASSDVKREASLFLSAEYRNGVRTKSALLYSLDNRRQSSNRASLDPQPKDSAVDRWQDEGGR